MTFMHIVIRLMGLSFISEKAGGGIAPSRNTIIEMIGVLAPHPPIIKERS